MDSLGLSELERDPDDMAEEYGASVSRVSEVNTAWDAAGFRDEVEAALQSFIDHQQSWLGDLGEQAVRLLDEARVSVSGGKRLRAAFCWWGHLAVAPPLDHDALVRASASLELLHASALVHDDYMDASDVRRGRPATHKAFEARHRADGWRSNPEQYGASAAILLGDLLLSWADEMLRTSGLPAGRVLDGLDYLDLTRSEVVMGQFLDVSVQARGATSVAEAMNVLRYKSAKYSIERPLNLGAALAGADEAVQSSLSAFGLPVGEAFQLRDDLLGVFGDPAVTGKPAGDDLSEGKRTVLVAEALDRAAPADAARLDAALGTPLDPASVADLQQIIDSSGAREAVERRIADLTDRALTALDQAPVRDDARVALRGLAEAATQRTH